MMGGSECSRCAETWKSSINTVDVLTWLKTNKKCVIIYHISSSTQEAIWARMNSLIGSFDDNAYVAFCYYVKQYNGNTIKGHFTNGGSTAITTTINGTAMTFGNYAPHLIEDVVNAAFSSISN